ncbi:hypothetical protein CRUP_030405 [Coryphaenoides rupestris]|nr:hypothetical protein CRUP_030405 [Coryphaenoides rupestris]
MNIPSLGETLGSSLTARSTSTSSSSGGSGGGGWSGLSLKPAPSGRLASLFHTVVPPGGYSKLQDERLAMVDLSSKAEERASRHGERASRSSLSLSDCGDGRYSETEPMLPEGRLSGEEREREVEEEQEGGEDGEEATTSSSSAAHNNMPKESPLAMALQILVPFLLAGFGTVSAGMHWDAFRYITEIFILVPALLGLKGNLEMTLASRLSTAVNVGKMDSPIEKWNLIIGNLALKQRGHCLYSLHAAGFGDLITLAILAWISQGLYNCLDSYPYVSFLVCAFFLSLTPLWMVISSKHPASRTLLYSGWEPVITAMIISSIGGLILDKTVSDPNLAGIVVYTPVINGIGGNLVAIQSSRISTHLHFHSTPGEVPPEARGCYYPCRTFYGSGANHRSAQVLVLLVIPGHLIFLYTIHLMKSGHTTLTPIFMTVYLAAALLQVLLLLCIADWMVHFMWRSGKDPDSFSIPYLTALGDLLGTALLALSFHFLWIIGDRDSDVGD